MTLCTVYTVTVYNVLNLVYRDIRKNGRRRLCRHQRNRRDGESFEAGGSQLARPRSSKLSQTNCGIGVRPGLPPVSGACVAQEKEGSNGSCSFDYQLEG